MIPQYFRQFIRCHHGTLNRVLHCIGLAVFVYGVYQKDLSIFAIGIVIQELGHIYQYLQTKDPKDSPLHCLTPQSIFIFPILILCFLYIIH